MQKLSQILAAFSQNHLYINRCLVHPSFKIQAILRAVLRDEMIAWHKKTSDNPPPQPSTSADGVPAQVKKIMENWVIVQCFLLIKVEQKDGEVIISTVGKAVTAITGRLTSLSAFDGTESKVGQLVAAACSTDNLCRMDPAWHPWL